MDNTGSAAPVTSYIGNAIGIAMTLDAYGLDGTATLAEAGVDVTSTPGFDSRVPLNLLHAALIRHVPDHIDPLFGLKFAKFVNPINYHSFGVMLTSSTTLRAFCQRLQRYYAYVNTGDEVQFNDEAELVYRQVNLPQFVDEPFESLLHDSGWAAIMLKMIRSVSSPDFAPLGVRFAFSAPEGYTGEFSAYFRCPIDYDSPETALCFAQETLDLPLPGGNAELARHSERLVYNYLKTFTEVEPVNAARMALFELLPRGDFSLGSLAEALAMTEEDLSGQLKAHGTSYQQLLGDTRRELAEEYIMRADLSVNEIAYMLGFSDCSNFARSFRRWTGKSPSDFREEMHRGA